MDVCKIVADKLKSLNFSTCTIFPHPECCFFVAWNGVIVFVYDGFPPTFVEAKKSIDASVLDLKRENFGSKWPKTTLGAVNDDAGDLSLDDLKVLKGICEKYSRKIGNIKVPIRSLSTVEYKSRGLEQLHQRTDISLSSSAESVQEMASPDEKSVVNTVVQEWSDLASYLPKVNSPGSRIGSYKDESSGGATCVAFLDPLPKPLSQLITTFQEEVDKEFSGRYAWLDSKSFHCTLRSLDLATKGSTL